MGDMSWLLINQLTPFLNTPHFDKVFGGETGNQLPLNECGHPYNYEFVGFPGMSFPITKQVSEYIVEIRWLIYSQRPIYTDIRFGTIVKNEPIRKETKLPSAQTILERMEKRIGASYVWGGNSCDGIEALLKLYPPKIPIDERTKKLWSFQGTDCSGLLFEATEGKTPRNTSHLLYYGKNLEIDLTRTQIINLKPLDMILYPGHVLFVKDEKTIVESKAPIGVRTLSIEERVEDLRSEAWHQVRRFINID